MDKFDERLKEAKDVYIPTPGFVDRTMDEVKKHKIHHKRFNFKLWAPAAAGACAVLAIAIVFAPKQPHTNVVDVSKLPSSSKEVAASTPTESPAAISDGTDNASLDRDLSGVASSMEQSANDQSSVDNAVNDNKQEISIPTN